MRLPRLPLPWWPRAEHLQEGLPAATAKIGDSRSNRAIGQSAEQIETAENALPVVVIDHEVMHLVGEHFGCSVFEGCVSLDAVRCSAHELGDRSVIRPVVREVRGRDDADDAAGFDHGQRVEAHCRKQVSCTPGIVGDVDRDRATRHQVADDGWLLVVAHVLIEHRSWGEKQSPSSRCDEAGSEDSDKTQASQRQPWCDVPLDDQRCARARGGDLGEWARP